MAHAINHAHRPDDIVYIQFPKTPDQIRQENSDEHVVVNDSWDEGEDSYEKAGQSAMPECAIQISTKSSNHKNWSDEDNTAIESDTDDSIIISSAGSDSGETSSDSSDVQVAKNTADKILTAAPISTQAILPARRKSCAPLNITSAICALLATGLASSSIYLLVSASDFEGRYGNKQEHGLRFGFGLTMFLLGIFVIPCSVFFCKIANKKSST